MFDILGSQAYEAWRGFRCGYLGATSPICWLGITPCPFHRKNSRMQVRQMRDILKAKYPFSSDKIDKMPDAQVIAFYHRAVTRPRNPK